MYEGLGDLPARWRQRAAFLADYGAASAAQLWRLATIELERALTAFDAEALNLTEAAAAMWGSCFPGPAVSF
jgi:hypothetical protein